MTTLFDPFAPLMAAEVTPGEMAEAEAAMWLMRAGTVTLKAWRDAPVFPPAPLKAALGAKWQALVAAFGSAAPAVLLDLVNQELLTRECRAGLDFEADPYSLARAAVLAAEAEVAG